MLFYSLGGGQRDRCIEIVLSPEQLDELTAQALFCIREGLVESPVRVMGTRYRNEVMSYLTRDRPDSEEMVALLMLEHPRLCIPKGSTMVSMSEAEKGFRTMVYTTIPYLDWIVCTLAATKEVSVGSLS